MAVYIINNDSKYIVALANMLEAYSPEVIEYGSINSFSPTRSDLIIISGGHSVPVLWHNKEYAPEMKLITK